MRSLPLRTLAASALFVTLSGCPQRQPVSAPDSGIPSAPDAGAAPEAAPELKIDVEYQLADGGTAEMPFERGVRPQIEPTQDLAVRSNLGLRNVRVRVFDEADKAMVSDDALHAPTPLDPFDYRIHFPTPLKTGHRYTLVLDAQTGALFSDSAGRDQADQRLEFQILGEREKPTPAKKTKPTRRKRRH